MKTRTRAAFWPWLVLLLAWTVWIDLGRFHEGTSADTTIPVLVSLLEWTPFYWEQDRYGMLVPLLAMPIKSPLANLVFQSGCTIFAGLGCFFLLARYFFRRSVAPTIATAAVAWLLVFSDAYFPFAWLSISMFYGPALALGLGAFLLVERTNAPRRAWARWGVAVTMMILAHWINFSIGILLLLLFAARAIGDPTRERGEGARSLSRGWRSFVIVRLRALFSARLLLLAVGVAAGRVIMSFAPPEGRQIGGYTLLPVGDWLHGWRTALGQRDYGFGPWAAYALVGLLAGLFVWWRFPAARAGFRPGAAVAGLCAAVVYGLSVEASLHALGGGFPGRYLVPTAGILCVLGVGVGVASVWPLFTARVRRLVPPAVALVASIAVLARFGTPSWSKVRTAVDDSYGERTEDLIAANCTHIIGFYWQVWPSVLHSMIRLHDLHDERMIWGISHRAITTMPRWRKVPAEKLTLCAGKGHPDDVQIMARAFGLPELSVASERATIVVLDGDRAALRTWAQ